METKDVIAALRTRRGLSQEQLAERLYVTRQAVSRWENGETVPNTETLKRLSAVLDVSINTLLGAPRKLVCYGSLEELTEFLVGHMASEAWPQEQVCAYLEEMLPKLDHWKETP